MLNLKDRFCVHKTELVYTVPIIKTYSNGRKSSKREWIDHIVCTKCGKKWFTPTDEEVKEMLRKLNQNKDEYNIRSKNKK
jgi:Fe2+ or Zn2+ uptake regulation protein